MAHEEAFLVIVRVDEPRRDTLGVAGADGTRVLVEHVDAVDLHGNLVAILFQDVDVGFAEYDEQVALASVF